jgi:hypothetical protein
MEKGRSHEWRNGIMQPPRYRLILPIDICNVLLSRDEARNERSDS